MWRALDAAGIPFAVYAANDAGKLAEASRYPGATLIYRDADASTVNPADYGRDPELVAGFYWQRTLARLPKEIRDLGGRVWLELLNEPGREPEQAAWVGRVMAGMARLALAQGLRVCGPGWAPGNPEPDAWTDPAWRDYLGLCAAHPERVAVSLHEYALETDIRAGEAADGSRWLIGRYEHLHAAVDAMKIARPTVFITECGWTLDDMPDGPQAREDIKWLAALYGRHANVQAAFLWTLQSGAGNGKLPEKLNALMPWLTGYAINPQPPFYLEPYDPPLGGEQPPVIVPVDKLDNGDFEGGWHHPGNVPELQIPAGWEFKWRDGNEPGWANPFDTAAHSRFMRPEVRTLPAAQLPEPERPVFIRDGKQTLKVFKGSGAWYATLMQTARGLVPGTRYLLKTPVWPDVVMRYDNGRKVFADDARACLWRARVGATVVGGPGEHGAFGGGWRSLSPGRWNEPAVEFTAAGTTADVKIDLLLPFPLPQNGIFADGWTLTADAPVEPPPAPEPPRPVKVVDISKWQGAINVERLKAAGVDGVMLRASYGGANGSRADERVDEYVPLLKAAGLPFGLYHFYHPARSVDEQYIAFSEVVKRHGYGLRLALDLEETAGLNNLTPEHARQFAARMAADFPIRDEGKAHLIYTSLGYWRDKLGRPAWGADYELWIAAWTAAARPTVPAPWTRWALWQWSSTGDGPAHGVSSSRIDLNHFNGDAADFAAWAAGTAQPPPVPEPELPAALWADAGPRPVYLWNPAFALAGATVADGLVPVSAEFALTHGGKNYTYQIALSGDRKTRRVYYAETGKWDAVKWTDGTATEPVPPPVVTPPPARTVDLLPFIRGDHRRQFDMGYDGSGGSGTQTVQVWHLSADDWLYVKGDGQYERLGLRTWNGQPWIFRFDDTSESAERFYAHYIKEGGAIGAPWFPRFAEVGRWYETTKYVRHYLKAGCVPQNGGTVTDKLRLVSWPRPVTYAASLARLDAIVTLEWANAEQYDFGIGRGCVAFRDANRTFWYIGDVAGRDDRPYRKPGCLELGW
jgi:lysozyme